MSGNIFEKRSKTKTVGCPTLHGADRAGARGQAGRCSHFGYEQSRVRVHAARQHMPSLAGPVVEHKAFLSTSTPCCIMVCSRKLWLSAERGDSVGGRAGVGAVGVAPANIRWSRPGPPGEIVGKVRHCPAVPAADAQAVRPHELSWSIVRFPTATKLPPSYVRLLPGRAWR